MVGKRREEPVAVALALALQVGRDCKLVGIEVNVEGTEQVERQWGREGQMGRIPRLSLREWTLLRQQKSPILAWLFQDHEHGLEHVHVPKPSAAAAPEMSTPRSTASSQEIQVYPLWSYRVIFGHVFRQDQHLLWWHC